MDMVQGTLDVLVLRGLTWGPKHGYAVARWIEQSSGGTLTVLDGALYTALHRMEDRGLIAAEWGVSDNNRRARFYKLTRAGRKQVEKESQRWEKATAILSRFVAPDEEPV